MNPEAVSDVEIAVVETTLEEGLTQARRAVASLLSRVHVRPDQVYTLIIRLTKLGDLGESLRQAWTQNRDWVLRNCWVPASVARRFPSCELSASMESRGLVDSTERCHTCHAKRPDRARLSTRRRAHGKGGGGPFQPLLGSNPKRKRIPAPETSIGTASR
jgi:hypothetical protein